MKYYVLTRTHQMTHHTHTRLCVGEASGIPECTNVTAPLGVLWFQAEDRLCDRAQAAGRQGGAAHPGLHDAHEHLHTGESTMV